MTRKPKQIIDEQNKQAERDLARKQAQSVAVVKPEPLTIVTDGWDDTAAEAEARLIRGALLKFADWKWSIGKEKEAVEVKEGCQLIAVARAVFAWPLSCASQIRSQQQRQRGWKLYSFHAPETECIGKGKASAPYEFGVKASIVTTNRRAPGGLFVLHAKSLPGNPYDGHTLRDVIEDTQKLTGCEIERAYVDKGYRGHDAQNPRRVFISGQKRGVFGAIKRELRRRSAIEPVIGHMKAEGHLGRCYLKGRAGDAANTILTAVGYNFRRILAWLRAFLRKILIAILRAFVTRSALNPAS